MHSRKGFQALAFRSVSKAETDIIYSIGLDPEQSEQFFDPVEDIVRHVRRGPSHTLVLIKADGANAGFFVLRPDHRTTAAWWLAWLAIGLEHQGAGLGRASLGNALRRLENVPGIRFVRLLVVRENESARRLYAAAGFRVVGTQQGGTELVMELSLNRRYAPAFEVCCKVEDTRIVGRLRRFRIRPRSGRHIAPVLGTERGPPVQCSISAASRRAVPRLASLAA
jgi:RimJ/RimL family protein N-acetyltransferase